MKRLLIGMMLVASTGQSLVAQHYAPMDRAVVCENGSHRFTRALYPNTHTDYRVDTSDRPVFDVVAGGRHKYVRFVVAGVALEQTDYCWTSYESGIRKYVVQDRRLRAAGIEVLRVNVVVRPDEEGVIWQFIADRYPDALHVQAILSDTDTPDGGQKAEATYARNFAHFVMRQHRIVPVSDVSAYEFYTTAVDFQRRRAAQISFTTPDPYINTLGGALVMAADGNWNGQTWRGGSVDCRTTTPGWRAAMQGDVLGWPERTAAHFAACTKDEAAALSLNDLDQLLSHFQYDANEEVMRQMWPAISRQLQQAKQTLDPDGDHLYDARGCVWAGDALNYGGAPVAHASAYAYHVNLLAAAIAQHIGEDASPLQTEAEAILKAMNERLWIADKGHWAEYIDVEGYRRRHESAALWSVYGPIDCEACSAEQAYRATLYVDQEIPHADIEGTPYQTVLPTNWQPQVSALGSANVAEAMHTALAYFQAGRHNDGYRLLMAGVMDQMYEGPSPANFGQHSDASAHELGTRDDADCTGITARALIEGLFGIQPRALDGTCIVRPGFPEYWDQAAIRTPYVEYKYTRVGNTDRYEITQHFRQPLKMVVRQNLGGGRYRDVEGTDEQHQVITVEHADYEHQGTAVSYEREVDLSVVTSLQEPQLGRGFHEQNIAAYLNANVADVNPAAVDDSGFRQRASSGVTFVAGVPFRTPQTGHNVAYAALGTSYPDEVVIPLEGKARMAYLLMAGTTNHMQSHIDNGLVVVSYMDGRTDTLALRNPDNWCPIEQDYPADSQTSTATPTRPYRIGFATGRVSRNLSDVLGLTGGADRRIPGGAAQMLCMPLDPKKKLKQLKVVPLSNDVVVGLMGITLQ